MFNKRFFLVKHVFSSLFQLFIFNHFEIFFKCKRAQWERLPLSRSPDSSSQDTKNIIISRYMDKLRGSDSRSDHSKLNPITTGTSQWFTAEAKEEIINSVTGSGWLLRPRRSSPY